MLYKNFLRPLLFLLSPEQAHNFSAHSLKFIHLFSSLYQNFFQYKSPRLENNILGLHFSGPVGLAAGFDKDALLYPPLSRIGFNFIESGTFTFYPQKGNPRPRVFRFSKKEAMLNRMGFNNPGVEKVFQRLYSQNKTIPRGINIGKSKIVDISMATEDYLKSLKKLSFFADYVTINISSPNTPNLRALQVETNLLKDLLISTRKKLHKDIPLFVKLSPDLNFMELDNIIKVALDARIEGLILSNTSMDHSEKEGGLSGKPIRDKSTNLIRHCFSNVGDKLKIIGVGGIHNEEAALEKILAGASLVQIYTGYIYQGPFFPYRINRYIDQYLEKEGLEIKDAIGLKS